MSIDLWIVNRKKLWLSQGVPFVVAYAIINIILLQEISKKAILCWQYLKYNAKLYYAEALSQGALVDSLIFEVTDQYNIWVTRIIE